jgi:hypothetical protein
VVWGSKKFIPGPFYTGDMMSVPLAWAAIIFLVYGIVLSMFPSTGPDPTPDVMNYTIVVNMAVWGGATLYYLIDARKWFKGPKTTLEEVEGVAAAAGGGLTEEQREQLVQDGFAAEEQGEKSKKETES